VADDSTDVNESPGPEKQKIALTRSGPKTAHGKTNSKRNAIKTGIFAKNVLASEPFRESADDYLDLLRDLHQALCPVDAFEGAMVEKLAFNLLQLSRVYKADAEIAPRLLAGISDTLDEPPTTSLAGLAGLDTATARKSLGPDLLLRYATHFERQLDRTLGQLEWWRRLRGAGPLLIEAKASRRIK
jgi:hypothetical protein